MTQENKNLAVLTTAQALFFFCNATLIYVAGLAGKALAADKSLATLTVTAWVLGVALATLPISLLMKRIGRRAGFMLGALVGLVGALIGMFAIHRESFWLLCAGMMVFGIYGGAGMFYRFAASDAVPAPRRGMAISITMAGGLVGGYLGPLVARHAVGFFEQAYLGAYLSVAVYLALTLVVLTMLRIPPLTAEEQHAPGRPLGVIAAQPAFMVAVIGAAIGFGVMNFVMVATPLAMDLHGHHGDTAFVIQWHIVAMFAPSFAVGFLMRRFGVLTIMLAGAVALGISVAVAVVDVSVMHFWWALVLLGIGWNFLFVGGTTLLTETHQPAERAKTQGVNDLIVSATQLVTSVASGWMLARGGWTMVNYLAIPLIVVAAVAIAWLMLRRRTTAASA